jgi:hypothetical protein
MAIFAVGCLAGKPGIEIAVPALKALVHDKSVVEGSGSISEDARVALAAILSHAATRKRKAVSTKTIKPKRSGRREIPVSS